MINFRQLFRYNKIVFVIMVINIILAYCLGNELFDIHQVAFGSNLGIQELLNGYDRTVIGDWLNNDNGDFNKATTIASNFTLLALAIQFLLNVGLIASVAKKETTLMQFWANIIQYFLPFTLLTLLFLVLFFLLAGGVGIIYLQIFNDGFGAFKTELPLFYGAITGLFLILCIGGIFWIFVLKMKMLRINHGLKNAIGQSIEISRNNFGTLVWISLIMIFIFLSTSYLLNIFIMCNSSKSSILLVLFSFLGFLLLYFKILFKIWIFATVELIK